MIREKLKSTVRDIHDFPKPGIVFKDVTPIFKDPQLCTDIVNSFAELYADKKIDVIAGIESRGFLFGLMLANRLGVPFVPVRKPGKLPCAIVSKTYDLEYGSACIEIHKDAFVSGSRVLIHDDLLATGGTASAAGELVKELGGIVAGYCFIISLDFLKGKEKLAIHSPDITSLVSY